MEKVFPYLKSSAQALHSCVQTSQSKHRCSFFYSPSVLGIDLCQGPSGILGESIDGGDYTGLQTEFEEKKSVADKGMEAGGDWQEDPMDGWMEE